jgi:hypothetical protein
MGRNTVVDDGLPRVGARHDFERGEKAVAVGVIAVMMRVDDPREGLAGRGLRGGFERFGVNRRTESVDGQESVRTCYDACVAQARVVDARPARLRVGVDVRCQAAQFGRPGRNPRRGS